MGDDENRRTGKFVAAAGNNTVQVHTEHIISFSTTPHCAIGSPSKKTVIKWPVLPGRVTRSEHGHLALVAGERNGAK